MGGHKERRAKLNREAGVESRYRRCEFCKKLRLYVPYPNHHAARAEAFTDWKKLDDGRQKCYLCVRRENGA